MIVSDRPKLLWIGNRPAPREIMAAAGNDWTVCEHRAEGDLLADADIDDSVVVIVDATQQAADALMNSSLAARLGDGSVVVFFMTNGKPLSLPASTAENGCCIKVSHDVSAAEMAAHLNTTVILQKQIVLLAENLSRIEQADTDSPGVMMDEEMKLAARLQRDFLPHRLPEVGSARFGVLFKPASFVSGDIYDVVRLDESHIGFYIADAVGHGMPAALMTMFIKNSLLTKRIVGHQYELVSPDVTLAQLNEDICGQDLSNCQFCSAVYAVVDVNTLELTYAIGGHPRPIVLRASGEMETLESAGGLLGLFEDETFESETVQLYRGDRVLFYTDGAEDVLQPVKGAHTPLCEIIDPIIRLPREDMLFQLTDILERASVGQPDLDDCTAIVLDIEK